MLVRRISPAAAMFALVAGAVPAMAQSVQVITPAPVPVQPQVVIQQPVCGAPVITQLMGGSPEERAQRYREGSPVEMLPLGVPQEIFAGRMFAAQTPAYVEAAKRAGDAINATVASQSGHFVFIDPGSSTWPQVVKAIRALAEPRP